MKKSIVISVADCNHGFWEPEIEETKIISIKYGIDIEFIYADCNQDNIAYKCQGSDIIAVQRLFLNKKVLENIPTCKVVVRLGVGLDNINLPEMNEMGIKVVYFPGFCTEEVANHALSMILSSYRRLNSIQKNQLLLNKDVWGKSVLLDGVRSASNTTVGIIGYGRIGKEVARRLWCCGFNVIAYDPYVICSTTDYSLEELFEESDIVTIHCSLTEETSNMVNINLLSRMKRGSSLVNTSRGGVVNSKDLIYAINSGKLRMAYIDVCDTEPAIYDTLSCNNIYVTPHVAFYSYDSMNFLKREFIKRAVEAFYGM